MSLAYDTYIKNHVDNLKSACEFIFTKIDREKIDKILPDIREDITIQLLEHDQSKYMPEEYTAYDNYFYHGGHATKEGKEAFDRAFLHHIHHNPHHWQYWVLIDDWGETWAASHPDEQAIRAQDIPDNYIFEMICDWWSFSWDKHYKSLVAHKSPEEAKKDLYEVFNWYQDHTNSIYFSDKTRTKVESMLNLIRETLDSWDFSTTQPEQVEVVDV